MSARADWQRADALLRPAEEASYRLPVNFGGLSARLWTDLVQTPLNVTIRGPRELSIEDLGTGESPEGQDSLAWARRELASMIGHRWPADYAKGDGRWAKHVDDGAEDPSGRLVSFVDDPFASSYRVQAGHLTEVHRTAGPVRFTIVIGSRMKVADGRHLPTSFSVYFWDLDGAGQTNGLNHVDTYIDSYVEIAGMWLPSSRRVTTGDGTGLSTRELILADHVLLET